MNNTVKKIIEMSNISAELQSQWKEVSDTSINNKSIEPLTEKGLIQAIDYVSYQLCMDGGWCAFEGLTEQKCSEVLSDQTTQIENILYVIALASGIHPTAIEYIVDIRAEYYTDLYIDAINRQK